VQNFHVTIQVSLFILECERSC